MESRIRVSWLVGFSLCKEFNGFDGFVFQIHETWKLGLGGFWGERGVGGGEGRGEKGEGEE